MLITELHVEFGNIFTDVIKERKTQKYQFSLNKLLLHQMDIMVSKNPQSGKETLQLRIFNSHIYLNTYTHTKNVYFYVCFVMIFL